MVPKGHEIPWKESRPYRANRDSPTSASLWFYEGEARKAEDDICLAKHFAIKDLPAHIVDTDTFTVELEIDAIGIQNTDSQVAGIVDTAIQQQKFPTGLKIAKYQQIATMCRSSQTVSLRDNDNKEIDEKALPIQERTSREVKIQLQNRNVGTWQKKLPPEMQATFAPIAERIERAVSDVPPLDEILELESQAFAAVIWVKS